MKEDKASKRTLSLSKRRSEASLDENTIKTVINTGKRRVIVSQPSAAKHKPAPRLKKHKPKKSPSTIRVNLLDTALGKTSKSWRAHWPLALGIEKQIFKFIADRHLSASKRVVQALLQKHCNNPNYLRNTTSGPRYDLSGATVGEVFKTEEEYAKQQLLQLITK